MAAGTDNADIMGKVFTTELSTDAGFLSALEQFLLQLNITERLTQLVAFSGQVVVIARGTQFGGFQAGLGAGAADAECHMVRRAGCGAEGFELADQPVHQGVLVDGRFGLLVEVALVGTTAAFDDEQEFVLIAPVDSRSIWAGRLHLVLTSSYMLIGAFCE